MKRFLAAGLTSLGLIIANNSHAQQTHSEGSMFDIVVEGIRKTDDLDLLREPQENVLYSIQWQVQANSSNFEAFYSPKLDVFGLVDFLNQDPVMVNYRSGMLPSVLVHELAHRHYETGVTQDFKENFVSTVRATVNSVTNLEDGTLQADLLQHIAQLVPVYKESYGSEFDKIFWGSEIFATIAGLAVEHQIVKISNTIKPIMLRAYYRNRVPKRENWVQPDSLEEIRAQEEIAKAKDVLFESKQYWTLDIIPESFRPFYEAFFNERFFGPE